MNGGSFIMARRRSDDKRRRILQAAVKVFARKGYFGAKVAEIARRAGVADGTIYLYFDGKEDILVSLFDEVMSEHVQQARRQLVEAEGAPRRLLAIARHHLEVLGADRDLAVVFQVELRQSTKFMERFSASWLHDYLDLVGDVIEAGQREGTIRPDVPRKLVANAFFGALDEIVTSWILARKDYDLANLAAPVADLFLRGIATSGAATARPAGAAAATGGA
jgi:TetR/AcrR family fatty acid metabolism transcriptional regulator